ncbi:MAG: endo-1,4-beta-xylanase [Thermoguttaceae bacterium]|nr:endo-1,4-beta-xylanase [Thermoguttaceae bacterium]
MMKITMKPAGILSLLILASALFPAAAKAQDAADPMSPGYYAFWNDEVQRQIDERIEKYRKADAHVWITGVKPGSEVQIEMIRHKFLFGAHIFSFDQLGSDELNAKYKETYGTLFNAATIPFYWKAFEREQDHPRFAAGPEDTAEFWKNCPEPKKHPNWRRPATDPIVDYLQSRGVVINGHPLVWSNIRHQVPEWLSKDKDEIQRLIDKRITEIAEHYGGRIDRYDVVNESASVFGKEGNAEDHMPENYTLKAFKKADSVFPKSVLFNINDYAVDDRYARQIQWLVGQGCRIDVVGIQMHLFNPADTMKIAEGEAIQTPEVQDKRLGAASRGGRPLHLSEITITAPGDDQRGRAIQAIVARNLYRYWFSWPTMMGITWWNTVDDCAVEGEPRTSGLFTRQMEPKPSFYALDQLINHEWKTSITAVAEESTFDYTFRGFKGTYEVRWTTEEGEPMTMTMRVE